MVEVFIRKRLMRVKNDDFSYDSGIFGISTQSESDGGYSKIY